MEDAPSATFKEIDENPTLKQGWINENGINLLFSRPDLRNNVSIKYSTHHRRDNGQVIGFPSSWNADLISISPSGKFTATLNILNKDSPEIANINVWQENQLISTLRTSNTLHGAIYTESRFCSLTWSNDETKIVYIAEKKREEGKSFWANNQETPNGDNSTTPQNIGKKFDKLDDWGEQLTGKSCSKIFLLDLKSQTIKRVNGIPDNLCCGDVSFTPDDTGLVFSGWDCMNPTRYGFIYCFNRKCEIYHLPLQPLQGDQSQASIITPKELSCWSPRWSTNGKYMAYLATREIATHNTCSMLCILEWGSNSNHEDNHNIVIDVVQHSSKSSTTKNDFNGIYTEKLPQRCWLKDSQHIVFNTFVGSRVLWKKVDVFSRQVTSGTYISNDSLAYESILDMNADQVLVAVSNPTLRSCVYLLNISGDDQIQPICLYQTKPSTYISKWSIESIPSEKIEDKTNYLHESVGRIKTPQSLCDYEAILILPEGKTPENGWPLIVDVHGGPHGCYPAMHRVSVEFFCALGYVILVEVQALELSLWVREHCHKSICITLANGILESLLGRVGSQDIQDVHQSVEYVVSKKTSLKVDIDRSKIFCTGGSHGGFICCHLIGKYPGFYKACAVRNPVTNLASCFVTSDIPDWSCAEAGLTDLSFMQFPQYSKVAKPRKNPHLSSCIEHLLSLSPMGNNLSLVTTPTLFGLGAKDRRVPPTEGLQFQKTLKSFGVPTRVLWYPEDCHPLDSMQTYPDFFVNMALWFSEYQEAS